MDLPAELAFPALVMLNQEADRPQWSEFIAADDPEAQAALIKHAAEMGISEDGNVDDEHDHSDNEMTDFGQTKEESTTNIYVSVLDPVDEPAFKPSKTKPLPKWMSLLPNNVHCEREQRQKASISESYPHSHEMEGLDGRSTSVHGYCPSESNNEETSVASSNETTPKALSRSTTEPTSAPIKILDSRDIARKGCMPISVGPKGEYTFGDVGHRESIHMAPPEYASRPLAGQKTRYSSRRPPSMSRSETVFYFTHGLPKYSIPESGEGSCCPLAHSPELSPDSSPETPSNASYVSLPSDSSSPFVVQSSEYLERYQPKSAETKYVRYVAKEREPVIERIKRQRVGKRSVGEVAEERAEKRMNGAKSVKLGNEEYGLDPRREDLKKELRNLFCEE